MNPTDKHKEQARQLVETPFGPFPVKVGQSPDEYAAEWRELLIDRIAAALSAKDAEIEAWRKWASHEFGIVGNGDDLIRVAFTEYAQKLISELRSAERLADFATSDRKQLRDRLAAARVDAIRECVMGVDSVVAEWVHDTKIKGRAFSDKANTATAIRKRLESLLTKEKKDAGNISTASED